MLGMFYCMAEASNASLLCVKCQRFIKDTTIAASAVVPCYCVNSKFVCDLCFRCKKWKNQLVHPAGIILVLQK